MSIYTLFHPEVFQGRKKSKIYFEGWYFKLAVADRVLALIPGISLGQDTDERHAFIQVFSSTEQRSWYVTYPFDAFFASKKEVDITIAGNRFSTDLIKLDIDSEDLHLHGVVEQSNIHPYPVTPCSPGIMGWYAYVPFMECFHGVVSMTHSLSGAVKLNGSVLDFSKGNGYIEKDWGTSFPSAWIWMQSNCFASTETGCMLSVATIPFLGRSFTGFLGFVLIKGRLIRFGTYTKAKIIELESDDRHAHVVIKDKRYMLQFDAMLGPTAHLAAPRQGKMERGIFESIKGTILLQVVDIKDGHTIFEETGTLAGIELSEAQLEGIHR